MSWEHFKRRIWSERWLRVLLKSVSVTVVLLLSSGIVLVLVVHFGSCRTALSIASLLAPEKVELHGVTYTRSQIARVIMSLRRGKCEPKLEATVIRFCEDEPNKALSLYEEALLAKLKIETYGAPIDELKLHVTPGAISGPPGEGGAYQQAMDDQTWGLKRGTVSSAADVGRWEVEFASEHALQSDKEFEIPIHYYALTTRSGHDITCTDSSRATSISYEIKTESSESVGAVPVVTAPRSWTQLNSDLDTRQYFSDKRATAIHGVQVIKESERQHGVHTGWSDFPDTYPNKTSESVIPSFKFCETQQGACY